MSFRDFNFHPQLMEGLDSMRFNNPTPIQQQAIPLILNNQDLIACAQTGTGKTAAYVLPLLHKIITTTDHRHLNTLILAPTRELAQQIDQQVEGFSYYLGISSLPIYGGGDGAKWNQQKVAMDEGVDIVIATPGRLIALLTSGNINLTHLKHLVLDEADRMLDMGFYEDILRIISYLPKERQTLLFSATMPGKIRTLAQKILNNPEQVNISISQPAEGIQQQAYLVNDEQKLGLIKHILSGSDYDSVLIFAGTKEKVKQLEGMLQRSGLKAKAFHSDLVQAEREVILQQFKSKQLPVLIGTDVLSRGIDVEGISLVMNYDVPPDPEDYIHRIGRTARAQTKGTAITFVNNKDHQKYLRIEGLLGKELPKMELPEHLGQSPVFTAFTAGSSSSRPKRKWKPKMNR